MTERSGGVQRIRSNIWPGDTFQFDSEQLNPSPVGPREDEWRANKTDEKKQQSGPQMTRDPRPNESSQSHVRPMNSLLVARE